MQNGIIASSKNSSIITDKKYKARASGYEALALSFIFGSLYFLSFKFVLGAKVSVYDYIVFIVLVYRKSQRII